MQANLGRVMGSRWYTGVDITGDSTVPTSYDTDVTYARENDLYLNTQNGNVYACTLGGDAETAKWVYDTNIAGPVAEIIDNVRTEASAKALSARQGKLLNDKILDGFYPDSVGVDISEKAYLLDIEIRNVDGTIFVTDGTESIAHSFVAIGVSETYNVSITLGIAEGFSEEGVLVKNISFAGGIHAITLSDEEGNVIFTRQIDIWDALNIALAQVKTSGYITDGQQTLRSANITKQIDGVEEQVYPVTHAKNSWYSKTDNQTVAEKLESLEIEKTNNTSTTAAISRNTNVPTMNTLSYALNRTTGIGSADTNYSTSMMRGIAAGTADLTAGTSALTSGAIYCVYQ